MIRVATSAAAAGALFAMLMTGNSSPAQAQEVKPPMKFGDMSSVSQDMLNRAAADGSNFLHTNGDYNQQR